MEFGQKNFFYEIDLFDFMSFLDWTFLNFLAHYVLDVGDAGVVLNLIKTYLWVSANVCQRPVGLLAGDGRTCKRGHSG